MHPIYHAVYNSTRHYGVGSFSEKEAIAGTITYFIAVTIWVFIEYFTDKNPKKRFFKQHTDSSLFTGEDAYHTRFSVIFLMLGLIGVAITSLFILIQNIL